MVCAPSDNSDQPGHPPSLISVFAVRMKKAWSLATHRAHSEDWSDWASSPGWSLSSLGTQPFCWFCHEAAHFYWQYSSFWSEGRRIEPSSVSLHDNNFIYWQKLVTSLKITRWSMSTFTYKMLIKTRPTGPKNIDGTRYSKIPRNIDRHPVLEAFKTLVFHESKEQTSV